ncbi:MAG: hypothetical protein V4475_07355 [Pseudomonadota bacterium]
MLPNTTEWKKWSTLNRVTYLAQLAVVVTLFVTSYFSYATWREAKEARRIQQAMFSAQNGPLIQIQRASVQESFQGRRTLMITFANFGGSVSFDNCATIKISGGRILHDYCENESSHVKSLRPTQSFFYSLPLEHDNIKAIGFVPATAATRKLGEEIAQCSVIGGGPKLRMLEVAMKFHDVLGQEMVENAEVAICDGVFVEQRPANETAS